MSSILIGFGKGLGDHVQVNAIIREYAKRYDKVEFFCLGAYLEPISFLYRDLPNVHLLRADTQEDRNSVKRTPFLLGGTEESGVQPEKATYAIAGVPFEKRWSTFTLIRDLEREERCTKALAPDGPYQFVHDDGRFSIDDSRLNPNLPIVRPSRDFMFFDYAGLIAGAQEVHAIESSFMFLTDHLQYDAPAQQLFAHRYARPLRPFTTPLVKKPWHILT